MREILRLLGYTTVTLAMVFAVIGIAQSGASAEMLAYSAIFIVVVLPVAIIIFMAHKEKRVEQEASQ